MGCSCGCTETVTNDARGETVCTGCGRVLAESAMVDLLTFGGGGKMHGQFVDRATGTVRGFASALYGRRDNSELALSKGFRNLERVADRLAMPNSLVEGSKRLYRLALQRSFTGGRNNYYVVSACLYAVCRKEKAAQMLIDFSDALMVPVKTLAKVFMKLTTSLCLQVPCVDPSLFMERFAGRMELGGKAGEVAQTGVKLVQSMTRDWLATGRRPLGLCAASLLISARYHGCKLNSDDINDLFRISQGTVEKRLREFRDTAVAHVAVKDFETTDVSVLPKLSLPPCVRHPSKKRRLKLLDEVEYVAGTPIHQSALPTSPASLALADAVAEVPVAKQIRSEQWIEEHLQMQAIELPVPPPLGQIPLTDVTDIDTACRQNMLTSEVAGVAHNLVNVLGERREELLEVDGCNTLGAVASDADALLDSFLAMIPESERAAVAGQSALTRPGDDSATASTAATSQELTLAVRDTTPAIRVLALTDEATELEAIGDSLSDVEDELTNPYILDANEKLAKSEVWDELMKDIMPRVYERARERRFREAARGDNSKSPHRRRLPLPSMDTPEDSTKAALRRVSNIFDCADTDAAVIDLFQV